MKILTDDEVGHKYADLMLETRSRLCEVEIQLGFADATDSKRRKVFIAEYCYLQIRRITELVSLAILIAHNPSEEFRASKLIGEWKPNKLLKMIGDLRPAAFPQRGFDSSNMPQERVFIANALPTTDVRDRICGIYIRACDKLHVGALKSIIKGKLEYDFNDIYESWKYFVDLLDEHVIYLPDGRIAYTKLGYPSADRIIVKWITLSEDS